MYASSLGAYARQWKRETGCMVSLADQIKKHTELPKNELLETKAKEYAERVRRDVRSDY